MLGKIMKIFDSDKVKPELKTNETIYISGSGLDFLLRQSDLKESDVLASTATVASGLRANAIANLKFYAIKRLQNGDFETLPNNNEINQILKEPNGKFNYTNFIKWLSQEYDFKGNSIAYALRSNNGKLLGLENVPFDMVKIEIVKGKLQYKINLGQGSYVSLEKKDVIHVKNLIPLSIYGNSYESLYLGKPIVAIAKDDILLQKYYKEFYASFLDNNGLPPLVLQQGEDSSIDMDALKQMLETLRNQVDRKRVVAALPDGLQLNALSGSGSAQQSGFSESMVKEIKQNISEAFGIPLGYLSGDNQNKATAQENTKSFYTNSVYPVANEIANSLTVFFQKEYNDETIEIIYDEFIIKDEVEEEKQVISNFNSGLITINEARNQLGYDAIDDDMADELPSLSIENSLNGGFNETIE